MQTKAKLNLQWHKFSKMINKANIHTFMNATTHNLFLGNGCIQYTLDN